MTYEPESRSGDGPLRIAPKPCGGHWTVDDWRALDFRTEADWQKAITIFEHRIRGRFLSQVETLRNADDWATRMSAGFSIMALDCLLVETLEQFRKGVAKTPDRKADQYFRDFLTGTDFGEYFDCDMADKFRDHIRNGLLHQGETKSSSRIWVRRGTPLVRYTADRQGLEINRELFHCQLIRVFERYVHDLRKNDPVNTDLRDCLKAKMDHICRYDGQIYVE